MDGRFLLSTRLDGPLWQTAAYFFNPYWYMFTVCVFHYFLCVFGYSFSESVIVFLFVRKIIESVLVSFFVRKNQQMYQYPAFSHRMSQVRPSPVWYFLRWDWSYIGHLLSGTNIPVLWSRFRFRINLDPKSGAVWENNIRPGSSSGLSSGNKITLKIVICFSMR
jgi:hypothetical protein